VTPGIASLPQLDTAAEEYKLFTSHNGTHNNINTCNDQTSQNNRETYSNEKNVSIPFLGK